VISHIFAFFISIAPQGDKSCKYKSDRFMHCFHSNERAGAQVDLCISYYVVCSPIKCQDAENGGHSR
jgi:hypothetical protein